MGLAVMVYVFGTYLTPNFIADISYRIKSLLVRIRFLFPARNRARCSMVALGSMSASELVILPLPLTTGHISTPTIF